MLPRAVSSVGTSACFTRKRSLVQAQYRPPNPTQSRAFTLRISHTVADARADPIVQLATQTVRQNLYLYPVASIQPRQCATRPQVRPTSNSLAADRLPGSRGQPNGASTLVRTDYSMLRPTQLTEASRQSPIPSHQETLDRKFHRHGRCSKGRSGKPAPGRCHGRATLSTVRR